MGERERQSLLTSWLRTAALNGRNVVNPVESFDLHYLKPYQLALLRKYSIPVPPTLVTNDPEEVKAFQAQIGELVYKPVAGGAGCKKLAPEDLTQEKMALLRNAPVLFQQYIPGKNIRAYVIGDKVVSSAIIHTDAVDYREDEQGIEKVQLPDDVIQMCIRAMKICGMKFTGIDLKLTPAGNFVLIECNPSPMFIGFQKRTGDPIDEAFAQFLIHGS
jgi:glutathione synthase/RimK-type ligase-like ATP-grasp enzyme